jgi:hypothetical protein
MPFECFDLIRTQVNQQQWTRNFLITALPSRDKLA